MSQVQVLSRHTCLLYESAFEQEETLISFLKKGLVNGEQCLFVAGPQTRDEWLHRLRAHGIDVLSHLQRGSLEVLEGWDGSRETPLNSIERARTLWRRLDRGLAAYGAVRYAVDLAGGVEAGLSDDRLCHWEATLDRLVEGEAVRVLCLYDRQTSGPGLVHAALRTHPNVIYRGRTTQSPSYEAPRILEQEPNLNFCEADEELVTRMLEELASAP